MEITKRVTGKIEISPKRISEIEQKSKNILDFKKNLEFAFYKDTSELVEILFGGSILLNASDIHLEPEEKKVKLRMRIDGVLHDILLFPKKTYSALLSRIKILSRIKLNITGKPQDGRFSVLLKETEIEIRTSDIPAEYGESIVMRILNPKSLIDLDVLGLRKDLLKTFEREITKPNGMIIVTGPTGSGKTTTLYSFLRKIHDPEIKIITIEDPIEYHLKGISQTQVAVEKGYNFANGLRSIVRQDPDVILVGEIRDLETASISLQAALTGHLVFTTLHTNDAAGAIPRLQALGEKSINIAPSINIVIAQRLVRKVCEKCVLFEPAPPEIFKKIKISLAKMPKEVEVPDISLGFKVPKIKGCKKCDLTGYKGRAGVFEAFLIDEKMQQFILKSPSVSALREKAIENGLVLMRQDGLLKVLEGKTTIEEVERTTGAF